ncbi:hypothetical protein BGW38_000671 [Lunasporangiospora selenospora]|uniref:Uncharacterized protein n=1 Tax=Lunasporangiospora selenospora TaxID=979761 RepID=A0A9P6FWN9_9FUNG|nr:hypothetical protein BGW38_000671 [Lunasporangiospora selenospora]
MDADQSQKPSSRSHDHLKGNLSASSNASSGRNAITSTRPPPAGALKTNVSNAVASSSKPTTTGSGPVISRDSAGTGQKRVYSWQSFPQDKLDAIAFDSHKQKKARLKVNYFTLLQPVQSCHETALLTNTMYDLLSTASPYQQENPPKCDFCPHARFASMAVYETHLQSKRHLQRVENKDKGQLSDEKRHELQREEEEVEQQQLSLYMSGSGKATATTTTTSVQGISSPTSQDVPEISRRFVDVVMWKQLKAWKGHITSDQHMRKVLKLMKGQTPMLAPLTRLDVLSAQDSFGWGTDINKLEEEEDAEEDGGDERLLKRESEKLNRIAFRNEKTKGSAHDNEHVGSSKNKSGANKANNNVGSADLVFSSDEESEESEDTDDGYNDPSAYLYGYNDKDTNEGESKSEEEDEVAASNDEDEYPRDTASTIAARTETAHLHSIPGQQQQQQQYVLGAVSNSIKAISSLTTGRKLDNDNEMRDRDRDRETGLKGVGHSMEEEGDDMDLSD